MRRLSIFGAAPFSDESIELKMEVFFSHSIFPPVSIREKANAILMRLTKRYYGNSTHTVLKDAGGWGKERERESSDLCGAVKPTRWLRIQEKHW